jgi:hypothetical protein
MQAFADGQETELTWELGYGLMFSAASPGGVSGAVARAEHERAVQRVVELVKAGNPGPAGTAVAGRRTRHRHDYPATSDPPRSSTLPQRPLCSPKTNAPF